MFVSLDFEKILKNKDDYVFIDVRTPMEYIHSTIPGSYNVPLFTDEQREIIGTLYKEQGRDVATAQGINFISEGLPKIYNEFYEIAKHKKKIAIFCARGGMRSTSIGSLLHSLGMQIVKINYGYKGYRNFIGAEFPVLVGKIRFITLYGKTGTGKTAILSALKDMGKPVLDLEACANHRGSLLGGIGLGCQNSQKMFESLVFHTLNDVKDGYIFTEGESKRIGKIIMPNFLYSALVTGDKILITASLEKRIEIIRNDYLKENYDVREITQAINKLAQYIGENKANQYIEQAQKGNFEFIIEELMIKYYDNSYKIKDKSFEYVIENTNGYNTAKEIVRLTAH